MKTSILARWAGFWAALLGTTAYSVVPYAPRSSAPLLDDEAEAIDGGMGLKTTLTLMGFILAVDAGLTGAFISFGGNIIPAAPPPKPAQPVRGAYFTVGQKIDIVCGGC